MADHIKHLTGHHPPSCPWRAFYSPLVAEVIRVAGLASNNLALLALEDDPPAIVIDGLSVYLGAKLATENHDAELREKEAERERRAALARRHQR
jgi:hypothetical protein